MQSALICSGILLLALAGIGTILRRRHVCSSPIRQWLYCGASLRRLRRLLRMHSLQHDGLTQILQQEILYLQQHLPQLAVLPQGKEGLPRLLSLASTLTLTPFPSAESITDALKAAPFQCTSAEIAAFPLALAYVQAERLSSALFSCLRDGIHTEQVGETLLEHATFFSTVRQLHWLEYGEQADPCHHQLLKDPSGTYPRMTPESRLALRLDAESFARHTHTAVTDVLLHLHRLCLAAGNQALEAYAGYWLQTAPGMAQLHQSLGIRAGYFYVRLAPKKALCRYILRYIAGGIAGFAFLQAGHPVFMLPFFLLCAGAVVRRLIDFLPEQPLPAVIPELQQTAFRILVVLPSVLTNAQEAAQKVSRLHRVSQILWHDHADFLLLADLPAHITAVSGQDMLIAQSALEAMSVLGPSQLIYLQRGRAWSDTDHIYQSRGGYCGALQELCRLIVHGENLDPISCASIDIASFERQYAYLLVLPEDTLPTPGMLENMLGTMMHPINARYPIQNGWRGYSLLTPENRRNADGCWLLRPDAFLEATEGFTGEHANERLLCSELAGCAPVPNARAEGASTAPSWEAMLQHAATDWRLLPWQLPWAHSSAGLVRNPMNYFPRFHLRDRLRDTALPIAQLVMLLWAVLSDRWLLLALVLLSSISSWQPNEGPKAYMHFLSLPTRAGIGIVSAMIPWGFRKRRLPPGYLLELWAQWITAAVMIALTFALPSMRIPALLLGTGFAAFPFLHRKRR